MIPNLETPRLRLRGHRPDDLLARMAMTNDPDVLRFIGGVPQDRTENWARILRYAGHWALMGWGVFALEERASGRFVGEVGLQRFERGLGADFDGAPEAAWVLVAGAAGQGYAREAATAAFAWHEGSRGRERCVCVIDRANARSLRLAASLGFRPYREADLRGAPVLLHERLPERVEPR